MVEREFASRQHFLAVLTGVAVAHQNVFAGKSPRLTWNSPVLQQADDRRHSQGAPGGMHRVSGYFFSGGDAFEYQNKGASRCANVDRFVTRV
jgi:hypothetical protein